MTEMWWIFCFDITEFNSQSPQEQEHAHVSTPRKASLRQKCKPEQRRQVFSIAPVGQQQQSQTVWGHPELGTIFFFAALSFIIIT